MVSQQHCSGAGQMYVADAHVHGNFRAKLLPAESSAAAESLCFVVATATVLPRGSI